MSKAATAVAKTADNTTNFFRFMRLSFRDLSFGRDTMTGAPYGYAADCIRGAIRWLKDRLAHQETDSQFLFGLQRRTYSRVMRDRRIRMARENLAVRIKSQTDPADNQGSWLHGS